MPRSDVDPLVREVFSPHPNGCGHRQALMAVRRLGLRCADQTGKLIAPLQLVPQRLGAGVTNVPARDFTTTGVLRKLGTDVTEFRLADGNAELAPIYGMHTCEIVA